MLYTKLDFLSYEIRLLNIQNAASDETVCCTLEKTTLINPGSYHALSHCWGDQTNNKKEIIINDIAKKVSDNLEAALRQLRSRKYLRVWIDILCINQDDLEERGLQIRNMRQIYAQAIHVITWLGDDRENIADAAKYLIEAGKYKSFLPRRRTAMIGTEDRGSEVELTWNSQRWRIFQSFFELSYWRRVWVIQETAVASRVEVLFGQVAIDWQRIVDVLDHWKSHSHEVPKACASYEFAAGLDYFRVRFRDPQRTMSLYEAIRWSHYALATDSRDRIYGLLGLTSDGSRLVPMPNYQRTPEEVLSDLIKAMLTGARNLDITGMRRTNDFKTEWNWYDARSLEMWSELNSTLGSLFCSLNPLLSYNPIQQGPNAVPLCPQGFALGQVC